MEPRDKTDYVCHSVFGKTVDDLVEFSKYDPELSDGIKWLDEQAQKNGISFYEMVFNVLYKHDVDEIAKGWLKEKSADYGNENGK